MDEEYVEAVGALVRTIPPGRAMTYGLVAEVVGDRLTAAGGRAQGGPREVGRILAERGGGWPWWRVVDAAGAPPQHLMLEALAKLRAEGTPLAADGQAVLLRRAAWFPQEGWGQADGRLM